MPLVFLYTTWKHQKNKGFLMFSGGYTKGSVAWNWFNKRNNQNRNTSVFIIPVLPEASTGGVLQKKSVLKNFANFVEKHLSWSLFLIKLQVTGPTTLLKKYSKTDVFPWNFFKNTYFEKHLRTTSSFLYWHNHSKGCIKELTLMLTDIASTLLYYHEKILIQCTGTIT